MRQPTVIAAAILSIAASGAAAQDSDYVTNEEKLLELIEKNSGGLTRALTLPTGALEPSAIWIHIRTPDQQEEAAKIADLLREGVHLGPVTRGVELQPVQMVEVGPGEAQVRYFKSEDRATANEIARRMADAGIPAGAADFVDAFRDASFIETGHIEIWLADK